MPHDTSTIATEIAFRSHASLNDIPNTISITLSFEIPARLQWKYHTGPPLLSTVKSLLSILW